MQCRWCKDTKKLAMFNTVVDCTECQNAGLVEDNEVKIKFVRNENGDLLCGLCGGQTYTNFECLKMDSSGRGLKWKLACGHINIK